MNKIIKYVITSSKTYEGLDQVNEALNKYQFAPGTRIFRVVEVFQPREKPTVVLEAVYEKSYPYTTKRLERKLKKKK